MGRVTFNYRDLSDVIDEIGDQGPSDLDGLGANNVAYQLKWLATDDITVDLRHNWMRIDIPCGGANGGGLVVLNKDGRPYSSTELIPGFRFVNPAQTDPLQSDLVNPNQGIRAFTNPLTGEVRNALLNRAGLDYADFDGFQNAMASLGGWNQTSEESVAACKECLFPGDIYGGNICAATNGLNREEFDASTTQGTVTWDS